MSGPQSHPSNSQHPQYQYGNPNQPMGYPHQQQPYSMPNQGGPGPSTMQQQQMQIQMSMHQIQMQMMQNQAQGQAPSHNLTPQQMAALQSMQRQTAGQAPMGQGQGPGLSAQQMQMALGQLQQGGGGSNGAQAFIQAMRNQQFQQGGGGRPMMPNGQLQQQPQQMMPQQRMQHFMGQPQQPSMTPDLSRIQMQQQLGVQGSPSHQSPRQPSYGNGNFQTPGSMPPPPLPPTQQAPPTPQNQLHHARFAPTPSQLQKIAAKQQQTMSDPNFQTMPQAQQQIQLNMIQHRMMSSFAQSQSPKANSSHAPSPSPTQVAQSPFSSLPSHMAPPRPGSAASQRAPSPRQSTPQSPVVRNISTPPPHPNQGYGGPSPSAPQHHTPQPHRPVSPRQGGRSMSIGSNGDQRQSFAPPTYASPQPNPYPEPYSAPSPAQAPPRPPIDTSDFPFDPRILPHIQNLSDSKWRAEMQTRNPAMLSAIHQASLSLQHGKVSKDVLDRMQQALIAMRQMQGRQGSVSSAQDAQTPRPTSSSGRPPSAQETELQRRMSRRMSEAGATSPVVKAMPPPAWIPGSTPTQTVPLPAPPIPTPAAPPVVVPVNPSRQSTSQFIPVPAWESALRLTVPFTSITPLPTDPVPSGVSAPAGFDPIFSGALPSLDPSDVGDVRKWLDADLAYLGNFDSRKKKIQGKMMNWAKESDMGTPWWMVRKGERQTGAGPQGWKIVWPDEKERDRERIKSRALGRTRREIRFTPKQLKAMADVEDHVIPIRLDMEDGQYKLKDTFMWNCADTVVVPELFAHSLCDDFNLPTNIFVPRIVIAINDRVKEYRDQVLPLESRPEGSGGRLQVESEEWELWRKFRDDLAADENVDVEGDSEEGDEEIRTDEGGRVEPAVDVVIVDGNDGDGDVKLDMEDMGDESKKKSVEGMEDVPVTVEEAMQKWSGEEGGMGLDDMRILIKVDIIVGTQNLSDTFEWDICSSVSPEEFAAMYTQELGLNGEFATALSHDIHEQILVHKRCLFLVGHTPGSGHVADDEVRSSFLPPISTVLRREDIAMSTYTPIFTNYTEEDVALIEREREKDSKRKKRATRARRGIILPDREPVKTHRTLLNPLGANGLVAAKFEDLTAPVQAAPGTSRRAAAIAAQANINLLSQDLPIPEKAPPSPAPVHIPKRTGRGMKGKSGLSRASPAGGREGSVLHPESAHGTPIPSVLQPPTLPSVLKRSFDDIAEDSPVARKRRIGESPPTDDVKPVILQPHPTLSRSRLNGGSTGTGSRSGDSPSKSRSPEKVRGSTPKVSRERDDDDDEDDSDSDSSDSSEDTYDGRGRTREGTEGTKKKARGSTSLPRASIAAVAPTVQQSPLTATPTLVQQTTPGAPAWFADAEKDTKSRYPKDLFIVVPKGKVEAGQPVEWRLRCVDCPGKIYNLGPGESYSNFEVHLKNRAHISNREKREAGGV